MACSVLSIRTVSASAVAFSAFALASLTVDFRVMMAIIVATRPPAQHQIHDSTEVHTHTGLSGQSLFTGILTRKQSDEPLDKSRIGNTIGHKGRTEPVTQRDIPRGISDKARIQPP